MSDAIATVKRESDKLSQLTGGMLDGASWKATLDPESDRPVVVVAYASTLNAKDQRGISSKIASQIGKLQTAMTKGKTIVKVIGHGKTFAIATEHVGKMMKLARTALTEASLVQHMKNTKTTASVLATQVEADIAQMGTDVVLGACIRPSKPSIIWQLPADDGNYGGHARRACDATC